MVKVSGLADHMQIFATPDLPLLFKLNVGNLGEIKIFIKDIRLNDTLKQQIDDSGSDNDYDDTGFDEDENSDSENLEKPKQGRKKK